MGSVRKLYVKIKTYAMTHIGVSVTLSVMGLLLAVMLILQSYVKNQYFAYLLEETDRRENAVLEAVAANINNSLQDLVELGCRIAVDGSFRNTVETAQDGVGRSLIQKGAMRLMAQYSNSIAALALITENGLPEEYGRYWSGGGYENLWTGERLEIIRDLYRRVMELLKSKNGIRYCVSEQPLDHVSLPNVGLFHLAFPLVGDSSNWDSVNMVVVISFRMDALVDNSTLNGYLTGRDDTIIYHENRQLAGIDAASYLEQLTDYEDISCPLGYFGWKAHALVNTEQMHERVNRLYGGSILVYLLLLFICGTIWQLVIRRLLRPVGRIREAMEDIRLGRQRKKIEIGGQHEIWQLAQDYNAMVDALHRQQDETERQHLKNTLSIKQKNRAERKALESQINAHFLCNTLTAINYNAVEAGNEEVASLLKNLSNMLAYSFSRKITRITLGQEIRWVEEYLCLQKFRLMEVFDYRIDFPEEYGEWPTCKLFLQPFVENSILHGFEGRECGGRIEIIGRPDGKRFRLSIRDNGCGMDDETDRMIQRVLSETHVLNLDLTGFGIGIQNAVTRLRMYYGEGFDIAMETAPDGGTCFTFWLPLVEQPAEDFA